MLLLDLLDGITPLDLLGDPTVDVRSLDHDSRRVGPGSCFACLPGARTDVAPGITSPIAIDPLGKPPRSLCEPAGSQLEVEWTVEGRRGRVPAVVTALPFLDLERKRA